MIRRLSSGDTLVIATHNPGKLAEFRELLEPFGLEVRSAGELSLAEPEETGTTFEENAELKALAAASASGYPALADDSGLAVDALDGAPGIFSARWAGSDKDFGRAMRNIEEKLQIAGASEPEQRGAQFVAVLCLAWPDGARTLYRGEVEGTLVWPPRGPRGFGYDPMFMPEGHERTFGEMTADEKHGLAVWQDGPLSHRARAFVRFAEAEFGDGAS